MGEGKCVVVVTHTHKKSRAGVNNTQKPSVWLFATSLSIINGAFPRKNCPNKTLVQIKPNKKKNKYKS